MLAGYPEGQGVRVDGGWPGHKETAVSVSVVLTAVLKFITVTRDQSQI